MRKADRFPYLNANPTLPGDSLMPLMPLTLSNGEHEITAYGMLDSGASVNVLPYSIGKQLGFEWDRIRSRIILSGNLARLPARGVVATLKAASFEPVLLAFAWTQSDDVRLILGQTNFFQEFDVCFFRSLAEFEVQPKA